MCCVDRKVSDATRVEVITDGLFTRRILSDPELTGIGAVNDGGPGGEVLEGNLIFNFVAETGGAPTIGPRYSALVAAR